MTVRHLNLEHRDNQAVWPRERDRERFLPEDHRDFLDLTPFAICEPHEARQALAAGRFVGIGCGHYSSGSKVFIGSALPHDGHWIARMRFAVMLHSIGIGHNSRHDLPHLHTK